MFYTLGTYTPGISVWCGSFLAVNHHNIKKKKKETETNKKNLKKLKKDPDYKTTKQISALRCFTHPQADRNLKNESHQL